MRQPVIRQIVGLRMWSLAYSIALSISFFLSAIGFHPGVLAQTRGLGETPVSILTYDTKISDFQSKLETARRTQADLSYRVSCLNKMADDSVSIRDAKELKLGNLQTQVQQLVESVETQQALYNGYKKSFEVEEQTLNALRTNLRDLQRLRDQQWLWIQMCQQEKHWTRLWGLTCEADMNLSQTFGIIKNYEGDITGAEKRVQIARDTVELEKKNLDQSRDRLIATHDQVKTVREETSRTEQAIVVLKSALSSIRNVVQSFQIQIDEYANALNEAKDVSVGENWPRIVRKLSDISEKIGATIGRSLQAISQTDSTLGEGWLKSCVN